MLLKRIPIGEKVNLYINSVLTQLNSRLKAGVF
jgi:hypothetical protein